MLFRSANAVPTQLESTLFAAGTAGTRVESTLFAAGTAGTRLESALLKTNNNLDFLMLLKSCELTLSHWFSFLGGLVTRLDNLRQAKLVGAAAISDGKNNEKRHM